MGPAIAGFICFLVATALTFLWWAIVGTVILSWLFAFDVINYRNRFVAQIAQFLDAVTAPILSPLRSIIPPIGGFDLSPLVALVLISGIQRYILPMSCIALNDLLGGF
ncbi:MAG: YggT family protein [Alphaproteobacteria bacterium]|nr:YggT family protein [Alphaproteobacteria bacterium]MBU1526424.1 YggT family protein [Alphaproteobacteria bacterium]MBU2118003.1 YggT family protein [Alphaproteobacteria bacterium]MBU2352255.1 YggT family protein [Alphaproteobacteria bacterium]MBU2383637.1 YggT family protein [Alphaproteobacteria bacterium]